MTAAATSERVRYDTSVTKVGEMVAAFCEKKILIFFGEGAPDELHDISVLHRPEIRTGGLTVGDRVVLDGREFPILAVGDVANDNLVNLGHIDLKFNGKTTAPLAGDVCLPDVVPPLLTVGSRFQILGGATDVSATHTQEQS